MEFTYYNGTSFPDQLSKKVKTKSYGEIERSEWKIYKKLINLNLSRIPNLGDYTVVHPKISYEFNPAIMDRLKFKVYS
ncbi:hypothetical protein FZW96_11100 [Bacillus sp. BGMRC 2118]|nr:hypothetical protein FZW96_11100 [Bacillus sp. BGMRC 2118]